MPAMRVTQTQRNHTADFNPSTGWQLTCAGNHAPTLRWAHPGTVERWWRNVLIQVGQGSSFYGSITFTDPSQWWDNRESKPNLRSPDSKHKIPKASLWINPGSQVSIQDRGLGDDGGKKFGFRSGVNVNARGLHEKSSWDTLSIDEALTLMEQMPQAPSVENLICILQNCRTLKNLAYTKRLYAYMCKTGLEDHRSLGNYLIPMLVQVGSVCDAQQIFNKLADRNVYSWTSLILGYVACGESQHALNLYQKMQEDPVHPDKFTFMAVLKACARLKNAERGQEIHAEIIRKGLERDLFVGNTLVDMYAKSGSLAEAREAVDKLSSRDEVSWNALMTGYAEHGLGEEALHCLEQMQVGGLSPNAVTLVCTLKACGSTGALSRGRAIHTDIARKGLERHLFLGSTLVDMYAKCDSLAEAQEVFDKLPVRNEVSWTALLAGYAEHGLGEEALNCLEQMQLEGVSANAVTFLCILKACGSIRAINKGREIHADIARKGLERHLVVGSTLIDMYVKCGLCEEAWETFDKLPVRNEVSWNTLMAGYAEHGLGEDVLNCFKQMKLEGLSPDAVTFVCSLKACGSIGAIDKGQEIHVEIARKGQERHLSLGNTLVDMYAKCGSLANAQEAFDKLLVRDEVSWNALMAGYAEHGLGELALDCLEQMQLEGLSPSAVSFSCSLKACGSIGGIDKGREIHTEIVRQWMERVVGVGSTLVDMYAKCAALAEAWEVFDNLPVRDVVSWSALIAGYAQLAESETVFYMLERMKGEGVKPNGVTCSIVLTVCSHTGLVHKGQKYFEAINKDYGITPALEHHIGMVDLLGRAGQLNEAVAMVTKIPFPPNIVAWLTVLAACQKWGNVELGRLAFEHAVQLDEKDDVAYVLMSNIYADARMLEEVKKIEAMRVT